jgi:PRTRC genetic system protein E
LSYSIRKHYPRSFSGNCEVRKPAFVFIRSKAMFQELMPLLAQRTLLLMISRVGADEIRINVIPQRLKSTNTDQNDALLTPLSISGTPKELDEALPAQLVEFVGTHLGLSSTGRGIDIRRCFSKSTARICGFVRSEPIFAQQERARCTWHRTGTATTTVLFAPAR